MEKQSHVQRRLACALVAAGLAALCVAPVASAATAGPLVGTFKLSAGSDASGVVTGSYFRMIQAGGTASAGPFLSNADSSASDKTYTFLSPGTDGGLTTGAYQPEPSPTFDSSGNSLARQIIDPTPFFGVKFAVDTAAVDPQTALAVPPPSISTDGAGHLSGDLRAFGASWNNQEFNQGSPKPAGTSPGLTAGPTGSYDSTTGAFTLDWTSLIVGGPFNGFTGKWHLTGIFPTAGSPGGPAGGNGTGTKTAPLVPTLKKVSSAGTARFKRKSKRFLVNTGYSFSCPAGGPGGTVTIRTTGRSGGKGKHVVARKTLSVAAGTTVPVKFALNRTGARLLRHHKRLRVKFRIRARVEAKLLESAGTRTLALR